METTITIKDVQSPDVLKAIYTRRAVRKYKDLPVDRNIIQQVIDAGCMAPSAMNLQPWHFYVLDNRDSIRKFSGEISKVAIKDFLQCGFKQIIKTAAKLFHASLDFLGMDDPIFYGAPVVIFITAPRHHEWGGIDIGMCAENMMLAAKAMGLDSCPVGFGKYAEHVKSFPLLRIPAEEQICLSVLIGYGNEIPDMQERKKDNVFFVH